MTFKHGPLMYNMKTESELRPCEAIPPHSHDCSMMGGQKELIEPVCYNVCALEESKVMIP